MRVQSGLNSLALHRALNLIVKIPSTSGLVLPK